MKSKIAKNLRFIKDGMAFAHFLNKNSINKCFTPVNEGKILLVIQPWIGTATPWFAISTGLMLKKKGMNVEFLLDDLNFGDDKFFCQLQSKIIEMNLKLISAIKYNKLSNYWSDNAINKDNKLISKLAKLNSIHRTRGELGVKERASYEAVITEQLHLIYACYSNFIETEEVARIFVPGGVWGSSGVIASLSATHSIQCMTYDSGEGLLILSLNGVASQLHDVIPTFNLLVDSGVDREFALKEGKLQLEKRRYGKDDIYDHFTSVVSVCDINEPYYLVMLNSVWDSAALGIHLVYDSMVEWIIDSINWVLNNTNQTIVIRQHPDERYDKWNNTDSYGELIGKRFGNNKRVVFIEAKDGVNSYDLVEQSSCVLGFSSTSIVEAVALGKPAVIVSDAYYGDLGIVFKATNKNEYYQYLKKSDSGDLSVTPEMTERAFICNYISQSNNWVKTTFTPDRNDFNKWRCQSLDNLLETEVLIEALTTNTPSSLIIHRNKMS